jgi:hypothetical protein
LHKPMACDSVTTRLTDNVLLRPRLIYRIQD